MTLHRFKPENHPQQVAKRGARPEVDERATDPELFARLHERFAFSIDVAALPRNAKMPRFLTPEDDGLTRPWGAGERVWCNPPYSDIGAWIRKAWQEWASPSAPDLIVMLLPANRTEQGWWQEHIEQQRHEGRIRVEFLPGRQRFVRFDRERIGPNERPPFGVCLIIWGANDSPSLASPLLEPCHDDR